MRCSIVTFAAFLTTAQGPSGTVALKMNQLRGAMEKLDVSEGEEETETFTWSKYNDVHGDVMSLQSGCLTGDKLGGLTPSYTKEIPRQFRAASVAEVRAAGLVSPRDADKEKIALSLHKFMRDEAAPALRAFKARGSDWGTTLSMSRVAQLLLAYSEVQLYS